jgi:pyruvate dehydrogenase (quinone)
MAETVSDFLINRLHAWGVRRIYGYPGDGITGIMGALHRASQAIDFVQVRHEEMAAFMASGHAKFTGEIGVCLATSGPVAIHLLNGLYDAKSDHQPVLALVGQQARASLGGSFQQEIDLLSLYKDVAHEYVEMVTTPAQMRHVLDRALRTALSKRTVSCIIIGPDASGIAEIAIGMRAHARSAHGQGAHVGLRELRDTRAAAATATGIYVSDERREHGDQFSDLSDLSRSTAKSTKARTFAAARRPSAYTTLIGTGSGSNSESTIRSLPARSSGAIW